MNVFFDEDGSLKAALVLADQNDSLQVELISGKRGKVKANRVLIRFNQPSAQELQQGAEALARELDSQFLWSCCEGKAEVGFMELAQEYYGKDCSAVEQAAMLLALHHSPIYFYRKERGRYRPAPEENLKAALAGLERKKLQEAQKAEALTEIAAGRMPAWMQEQMPALLYQPDKNTLAWKALEAACHQMNQTPAEVMVHCGVLANSRAYLEGRFQHEWFGHLADLPNWLAPDISALPFNPASAFSIDDAFTTEIDDAFSLEEADADHWKVGIHIAAPAFGIRPGSEAAQLAVERLSTVYMPGNKITMLPANVVESYSLLEGMERAVCSLWLTVKRDSLEVVGRHSALERIRVHHNLRLHQLEPLMNDGAESSDSSWLPTLNVLHALALSLKKARGALDRPEPRYVDYQFEVEGEQINISRRPRGAPLDTLVAELMIEVNSQWGGLLASAMVPALYRTQMNNRTSLSTKPGPHEGLGVPQYAWSSSPLRRFTDLVNQWQLMALLQQEVPPYSATNELEAIAGRFEAAYDAYNEFQRTMERYWSLRFVEQEKFQSVAATMLRDGLARLNELPLTVKLHTPSPPPQDSPVTLGQLRVNLWDLTLHCELLQDSSDQEEVT
jgi:exoribonuclease-2